MRRDEFQIVQFFQMAVADMPVSTIAVHRVPATTMEGLQSLEFCVDDGAGWWAGCHIR